MDEQAQLKDCTKKEKQQLAKYVCCWCEQPLHKKGCGAIYTHCKEDVRIKRRSEALLMLRSNTTNVKVSGTP